MAISISGSGGGSSTAKRVIGGSITAEPAELGYIVSALIDYATTTSSAEPILIETIWEGVRQRTFWLNETGMVRVQAARNEAAARFYGPNSNANYTGPVLEVYDKWGTPRVLYWGVDARGRPLLGADRVKGSNVLVLGDTDPIPANLPAQTVIIRATAKTIEITP